MTVRLDPGLVLPHLCQSKTSKYGSQHELHAQPLAKSIWAALSSASSVTFTRLCARAVIFGYFYYHYQRVVDDRLRPVPSSPASRRSTPRRARSAIGQKLTVCAIAAELRQAGYTGHQQRRSWAPFSSTATTSSSSPARRATTTPTAPRSTSTTASCKASPPKTESALSAYELETAADHRPLRRQQPHQAPPRHLRGDPPAPGAGGDRH